MKCSTNFRHLIRKFLLLAVVPSIVSMSSVASDDNVTNTAGNKMNTHKSAIVLAAFGTSYDSAVNSLIAIEKHIESAYPNTPVRFAFTSNIIRKKWHARQNDEEYKRAHPQVPEHFYSVKNVLGTLADLQNEGYKNIVVQTTLLSHGEEFIDLKAYVDALASIETIKEKWKPFNHIAIGRPLMGTWGHHYEYQADLDVLASALADDIALAEKNDSALVYMGHGNEHLSTGLYAELEQRLNTMYPQVNSYVGLVEGFPGFDMLLEKIQADQITNVTIKPLMVVAGDHATNDMAGDEDDSWKVMLSTNNINVIPVLEGLGSKQTIQAIYLRHLQDAAKDAGIELE
ncbi:sirohydrochlorin cobaltochelatase [Vibrio sp. TH_r3]|uniref:sirohydrochlorin cobaltochelatase n=1 Tax=Vibrio sp. TH_r3 TaxID=3082084 RepID=UPI0029549879|nr:sirohydrochlorin cobaltochelatase [Vibrio sp. TH_r3]MDV7103691.1 sirohydrochlorin cobaltochelatase [Vibrio sp. TH_r3]